MADCLEALMCLAISDWHRGVCRPYTPDQLRELAKGNNVNCLWPPDHIQHDLEWTVLLVPGLAALLDQATAQYGGTWPLESATRAVATRLVSVNDHGPAWSNGATVTGPSLLDILVAGDGQERSESRRRKAPRG